MGRDGDKEGHWFAEAVHTPGGLVEITLISSCEMVASNVPELWWVSSYFGNVCRVTIYWGLLSSRVEIVGWMLFLFSSAIVHI